MIVKIDSYIKGKGVSRAELAGLLGITVSSLGTMINNAAIGTQNLNKLCTVLNCKPGDLIEFGSVATNDKESWYKGLRNKSFKKLKVYLDINDISMYKLAQGCELSYAAVYKIVNGDGVPKFENAIKMCEVLKCKLADICDWEKIK